MHMCQCVCMHMRDNEEKISSLIILLKLFSYAMSLWLLKPQSKKIDSFIIGVLLSFLALDKTRTLVFCDECRDGGYREYRVIGYYFKKI